MDYAELDPSFIVRVGQADKSADPNAKSIGFSRDGGANWYAANGEPAGTAGGGKVALSANGNAILWSTPDVGVFYSSGGNSWTASTGVPKGAKIASDRVNSNKFYAWSAGNFYVSTNGGATFTKTAAAGLPAEGDLDFKAIPGIEGDIWLAGGNTTGGKYGLWHSTDSGASFTKLSNVQEANVIGFGKAAPGQSYMALYTSAKIDGVRGIFRSNDAGATWIRINDDQHQYASTNSAITGDPRIYGRVYIGTNGLGIVYGDALTNPPEPEEPGPEEPGPGSTISPTAADFDKNASNQADVTVAMTLNGNTLTAIRNGAAALTEGSDYTVSGSNVTILSSYLAAQPLGSVSLTFQFSAGDASVLNISIKDSTVTAPAGDIKIQMYNGSVNNVTNTLNPQIKLTNTGSQALHLSDVKLRYYYTIDGEQAQNLFCDWSQVGSSNVTGTFVRMATAVSGADYYAEIGFTSGAGSLAAGQSIDLQIRISKSDWSNYSQSDDYSFDSASTAYQDAPQVTGYVAGTLQWGIEP
ncbi:Xyloglucanase precursor [compost metagenome]